MHINHVLYIKCYDMGEDYVRREQKGFKCDLYLQLLNLSDRCTVSDKIIEQWLRCCETMVWD